MVAVDGSTSGLGADAVKLVAESAHVRRIIFIAGDDLVNRVDNDRIQPLVSHPPDHLWHQLIQRNRVASQIPDHDVLGVFHRNLKSLIDLEKTVDGRGRIDLQIDIEHASLPAGKAEPVLSFCNGDAELHQKKALSCFGGSGEKHLVASPQDSLDQLLRERRRIVLVFRQIYKSWKFIIHALGKVHPVVPALSADIRIHKILAVSVPGDTRHPGEPRGIPILLIDQNSLFFQKVVEELYTPPVFVCILRIDVHDRMQAFSSGMNEGCDRKFHLPEHRILLGDRHGVRFDQCIGKAGDVLILHAFPIDRIEADPCAGFRFPVADRRADIIRMLFERPDQIIPCPVIDTLGRHKLSVCVLPDIVRHIGDMIVRLK